MGGHICVFGYGIKPKLLVQSASAVPLTRNLEYDERNAEIVRINPFILLKGK